MPVPPPVALINMPFAPALRPSLQIGILRGLLDRAGWPAREFHATLAFFDDLVERGYQSQHAATSPSLVSEWYFSERPFDFRPDGRDGQALSRLVQYSQATGFPLTAMREVRERLVPAFLDELADTVLESRADVACFSLSFAQLNASFSLARRLKERRPDLVTVFGGAASQVFEEAARELMRVHPCIDHMVLGEAEDRFLPLVEAVRAGRQLHDLEGVAWRPSPGEVACTPPPLPSSLDASPVPSFHGWFEAREAVSRSTRAFLDPALPMEVGRGCTWADHAPCRFCAFTFHGPYRAKTQARVLEEAIEQRRRHGSATFYLMDNVLPASSVRTLLPALKEALPNLTIPFVETLTTLSPDDVETMSAAGVVLAQPGTECFDDGLLRRIGKGTTTLHNVRFLKAARESGIAVSHNLLLGVPGATPEEVDHQRRVLESIAHLDPPHVLELRLVRFSAYFENPDQYGLHNVRPDPFYAVTFPEGTDIGRVAYEFEADVDEGAMVALYQDTVAAVLRWQQRWKTLPLPYLVYEPKPSGVRVLDGRKAGAKPEVQTLDGLAGDVYRTICERPHRAEAVVQALAEVHPDAAVGDFEEILRDLESRQLSISVGGRHLGLAMDADRLRRWRSDLPRAQV